MLYSNDYHIVCFDTLDVCSSLNNIRALNDCPNFSFVRGDICSAKDVRGCFSKFGVDAVIHFAALTHVDTSFDAGRDFAGTNFLGTLNLLEAARDFPIKRFVHMSTDEVYGEIPPGGEDHIETSPLIPTNPYSGSKAAAEMMVCAYAKSFRIPTVVVRCNNVYGPNQFPESMQSLTSLNLVRITNNGPSEIIPKFLVLLLRGQKVPLYGHGRQTRRFIFGGDVANAINYIFHRGEVDGVYNIGTYDEISNRELTRHLVDLIEEKRLGHGRASGYELEDYIETVDDRPFHDRRYGVDFKRLKALGWTQKVRLDDGLRRT